MLSSINKARAICLLLCALCFKISWAQEKDASSFSEKDKTEIIVEPLQETTISPWTVELYASGGVNTYSYANLWTADHRVPTDKDKSNLYAMTWNLGMDATFYKNQWWFLGAGLGYKNTRLSKEGKSLSANTGIHNHYIYADVNAMWRFFGMGITVNRLMGTHTKTEEKYEYVGLYPDCFNKWYSEWYVSYRFHISAFRFEARMNMFLSPAFDPNKVAYYNQNTGFHSSFVGFEIKVSYRFFTNKRKLEFIEILDI